MKLCSQPDTAHCVNLICVFLKTLQFLLCLHIVLEADTAVKGCLQA